MDWRSIVFQKWQGIVRTIVTGVLAYTTLIVFLRFSGKRTLAKLNAFDLVVTVALGSTLSAILLQELVALAEGAVALALLILMQYLVTYTSVRWPSFARFVRAKLNTSRPKRQGLPGGDEARAHYRERSA